ncbi:hypothetical protein Rs2_38635 [Raphanus sativus]|nr:hypothetical protein Rs2_38635 [Raphanus sativus]
MNAAAEADPNPQPYHSRDDIDADVSSARMVRRGSLDRSLSSDRPSRGEERRQTTSFHQRLDHHGRPFGDRVSYPSNHLKPLKNKIIPSYSGNQAGRNREYDRRETRAPEVTR